MISPSSPEKFGSIEDARAFCSEFYAWYNTVHRHSGIGMHTPLIDVHHGLRRPRSRDHRASVLEKAYMAHPERFVRHHPVPPALPPHPGSTRPTRTRRPRQQTQRRSSASDPKRLSRFRRGDRGHTVGAPR